MRKYAGIAKCEAIFSNINLSDDGLTLQMYMSIEAVCNIAGRNKQGQQNVKQYSAISFCPMGWNQKFL